MALRMIEKYNGKTFSNFISLAFYKVTKTIYQYS
jgi:hypothetical protein